MAEFSLSDLARLARIRLSDEEVLAFTNDLTRILAMVESVRSVKLSENAQPLAMNKCVTVSRGDQVATCLDRAAVLGESPQSNAGYMKVPKVFE